MYAEERRLSSSSSQRDRRKSDSDLQDNSRASRKPLSQRDRRKSNNNLSDNSRASGEPLSRFSAYGSNTGSESKISAASFVKILCSEDSQQTSGLNDEPFEEIELDELAPRPSNLQQVERARREVGRALLKDERPLLKDRSTRLRDEHARLRNKYVHLPEQKLTEEEINTNYSKFEAKKRSDKMKEIVWEGHLDRIADICKKYKYIIAIRETGALSIKRIEEGAKAKPHSILEKSIKESSVKKGYEKNADEVLAKLKEWDLDGFVGHWGANHELIGVRIDKIPDPILKQLNLYRQQEDSKEPYVNQEESAKYVPLNLNEDGGGLAIKALKQIPEWKTYLYTGDYDLHEAYKVGQGQIPEATKEKVNLLNNLNKGIEDRPGEARLIKGNKGTKTVEVEGDHAMFQHGDQATYRMNQHLEAQALEKKVAKLVRAVATESDEPLAWCNMGKWFVTLNKKEHDIFRQKNKLTKPHVWRNEEDRRTANGDKKTEKYIY